PIAFLNESGFMLQPLVRRSWAPRGQTPVIRGWDRRDRLRVIGAITVPPGRARHRLRAVFRIHARNVKTPEATEFLRVLDRHVRGPLIVVLDRLNVHQAAVKRWLAPRPAGAPRVIWSSGSRPTPRTSTPPSSCGTTASGPTWPTSPRPAAATSAATSAARSSASVTPRTCSPPPSFTPGARCDPSLIYADIKSPALPPPAPGTTPARGS